MFTFKNHNYSVIKEYSGEVCNCSQRSDTHVYAPGPGAIDSNVVVNNEFWLVKKDGRQERFTTTGSSFVAPGHVVDVVSIVKNDRDTYRLLLVNKTTGESFSKWIEDRAANMIDPRSSVHVLLIALLKIAFFFAAWFTPLFILDTMGFDTREFAILQAITIFGVLGTPIFMFTKYYFRRKSDGETLKKLLIKEVEILGYKNI